MGSISKAVAAHNQVDPKNELGRRAFPRVDTLSLFGKIDHLGRTSPCVVRNISEAGAMLDVTVPLRVQDEIMLEFRGMEPTRAEVRWSRGSTIGVVLKIQRPITDMLQPKGRHRQQPRDPRFALRAPARVRVGPRLLLVDTIDISQSGVKLRLNEDLPVGQIALFNIGGLAKPSLGRVCWGKSGSSGIHFKDALSASDLSHLLTLNGAR